MARPKRDRSSGSSEVDPAEPPTVVDPALGAELDALREELKAALDAPTGEGAVEHVTEPVPLAPDVPTEPRATRPAPLELEPDETGLLARFEEPVLPRRAEEDASRRLDGELPPRAEPPPTGARGLSTGERERFDPLDFGDRDALDLPGRVPPGARRAPEAPRPPVALGLAKPGEPSSSLREAGPLDLARALGVDGEDEPPERSAPRPPEPDAERIDVDRFRAPRKRKPRRARAAPPARAKGSSPERALAPEQLKSLASTSDSLARVVPAVILLVALLASALVFARVFGGRGGATPHVRLELLAAPGEPPPRPDPVRTAHLFIETQPPGLVVFHEQRILGKTPCEVDIGYALPPTLGVRLSGPDFEGWMGQVRATVAGEYRVQASLRER